MQSHSTDLAAYGQSYTTGLPQVPYNEIMLALSVVAVVLAASFLVYVIVVSFSGRHKKRSVRINSHSSLAHGHGHYSK